MKAASKKVKEYRDWLKEHNICVDCRNADAVRGTRCTVCADKHLARRYKNIAAMTPEQKQKLKEYNKNYCKNRYKQRRANGLCVDCGKPAYQNHSRCYEHYLREKRKETERWKKKKKYWKEIGLCYHCGKTPVPGKTLCPTHLEEARKRMTYANAIRLNKKEVRNEF